MSPILFSVYVLRRWGYKVTFMLGLTIYGVGAILFWPCAKYRSFAGFCVCTFVVGLGLGTLEVSANPYVPFIRRKAYDKLYRGVWPNEVQQYPIEFFTIVQWNR
jgi:MFS transporter, FHS family, L-fucose permease